MAGLVKALCLQALLGACAGILLVAPPAVAQQLRDPTRPPSLIDEGEGVVNEGPVLQSILIAPDRKVAIISGQAVRVGEQFNGARLVSISETQVVLRNGNEVRTLNLFPDIDKHRSSAKTGAASAAGKTHRK
jgi:MSHA biogenesis protein MshK